MDKFMNEQFDRDTLIKEVGAPGNLFLLAYDGEEPLGYVRIREGERHSEFKNHTSIEIARIYATKSSIGKGVGKALMQECIRIAKDMKRDIIWLGVWEKNDRAIEFYRKWGFEKFAEHDFVLGTDVQTDWLMSRRVENL